MIDQNYEDVDEEYIKDVEDIEVEEEEDGIDIIEEKDDEDKEIGYITEGRLEERQTLEEIMQEQINELKENA